MFVDEGVEGFLLLSITVALTIVEVTENKGAFSNRQISNLIDLFTPEFRVTGVKVGVDVTEVDVFSTVGKVDVLSVALVEVKASDNIIFVDFRRDKDQQAAGYVIGGSGDETPIREEWAKSFVVFVVWNADVL